MLKDLAKEIASDFNAALLARMRQGRLNNRYVLEALLNLLAHHAHLDSIPLEDLQQHVQGAYEKHAAAALLRKHPTIKQDA